MRQNVLLIYAIGIGIGIGGVRATPSAAAFAPPIFPGRRTGPRLPAPSAVVLRATPPPASDRDDARADANQKDWRSAYSGLSNAWGYSRANVSDRARRRYGRRRRRHIRKMEGRMEGHAELSKKPVAPHGNIGVNERVSGQPAQGHGTWRQGRPRRWGEQGQHCRYE